MGWAPKYSPPWSWFFPVTHSMAARATVLIPLIGYMIIFNENVVRYLNFASQLGMPVGPGGISTRLIAVYLGLCLVAAGMASYSFYCPNEPKYYASAHAYVGAVQDSINKYSVSRIENEVANSEEQFAQRFWQMRESGRGIPLESEKQAGRNGILHVYYELKDYENPQARRFTMILFVGGFLSLLVPSAEVFLRVIGIMFTELFQRVAALL